MHVPIDAALRGEPSVSPRVAAKLVTRRRRKPPVDELIEPTGIAIEEIAAAPETAELTALPSEDMPADALDTELPPVEPPASWGDEHKECFCSLPREMQEFLSTREAEHERTVRQGQEEAAQARQALEADRIRLEQARQHYEQALPSLLAILQQQQAGEFADIRSMEDVERLARTDWPRYVLWDARQRKIAAILQEANAARERDLVERQQRFATFAKRENDRFLEKVPEFSDKGTASKLQDAAVEVLRTLGFPDDELGQMWRGEKDLSIHDHRLQLLVLDGVRYRDAQAKAKAAASKQVPPVLRPGVAEQGGSYELDSLTHRLDKSGSLKDAAALIRARRRGR